MRRKVVCLGLGPILAQSGLESGMAAIGGGVKGLVARAQREAQRRGQTPSTAHLLLVMLQHGGAIGGLLSKAGVNESELLRAIGAVDPESGSALERAVERSHRLADSMGAGEVAPAHLLLAIARDARSAAHRSLEKVGAGPTKVQESLSEVLGIASRSSSTDLDMQRRPTTRPKALGPSAASKRIAPSIKRQPSTRPAAPVVETEPPPAIAEPEPLKPPPARPPSARSAPRKRVAAKNRKKPAVAEPITTQTPLSDWELDPKRYPLLSTLGRNLTAVAHASQLDPVLGRDDEIEQLLDVLARRRSNNPMLVGPPGVGKTAIVEGLASRLTKAKDGVHGLKDKILVELSAGALISGTGVRGALSDRVRQLRQEVKQSEGRVILFVDETHALFMGGDSPDDLGHELKSSLARGELPCIGATTHAEYRKYVERDAALARRFTPVLVAEPSTKDALKIVSGIAPRYEGHHGVEYTEDAISAAVELSVRYIPEKSLPDKAIGLIDLAGARVRRRGGSAVERESVADVVAEQVQVPVERLLQSDADRMLRLESHLAEQVVGHSEAMRRIGDALRKGAAGFRGQRPLATFLFLGPTGVGKTETAKALNELFFPGCKMCRLDMSEYSESHAVSRLLGSPPGYVGHEEGGQLTEAVRHRPYQLVLLDEIEKANIDVVQALLPMLDEGRLTDARGRTVDFTNTIIIMTSNLGAQAAIVREPRIGFSGGAEGRDRSNEVLDAARKALPPEIWNRIDEPLYFAPLLREDVAEIARRLIALSANKLEKEKGVGLVVDESAIKHLVESGGFDAELGARPMRRVIGRLVEAPLATLVLEGGVRAGERLLLRAEEGVLVFEPLPEEDIAAE